LVGPALVRYSKAPPPGRSLLPIGREPRILREGNGSVIIVGIGKMARAALGAAGELATGEQPIDVTVVDPRVVRPADSGLVERLAGARSSSRSRTPGHGGAGAFLLRRPKCSPANAGRWAPRRDTRRSDGIHLAGKPDVILSALGLDAAGIAEAVRAAVKRYGPFEASLGELRSRTSA